MHLHDVLAALYAREINFGMQSFWDDGVEVWIGDDMNGRRAQANISGRSAADIARWLSEAAWELYPEAEFPWARGPLVIFDREDAKPTAPRAVLGVVNNPALEALQQVRAMCPEVDPGPAFAEGAWVSHGNYDDVARDASSEALWAVAQVCDRTLKPEGEA